MRLRVGSSLFAANSTDVRRRVSAVLSDRGKPLRYTHTLTVRGELEGDSQAELSAASAALQTALLTQYQDVVFLDDSGSPTDTALLNGTSISGVRVVDLDFPNDYGGAEYATLRSFSFVATADYLAGPDDTVRYSESVTVAGTGEADFSMRIPISGPPVKQILSTHTPVTATQSGEWVGLLRYPPNAPAPLWRDHELKRRRVLKKLTPRVGAGGFYEYPIQWSYEFLSAGPLTGPPGNPPRV